MAQNVAPTVDVASQYSIALDFYETLSPEKRASLPSDDSDDWFPAVMEAYHAAQEAAGEPASTEDAGKTRTAKHYTILLLRGDGTFEVVGSGFAGVGREPTDPAKQSAARKIENRAGVMVVKLARTGVKAGVLRVETASLPAFLAA
jgi:hypothetical protein